jgi:hypothetical protein
MVLASLYDKGDLLRLGLFLMPSFFCILEMVNSLVMNVSFIKSLTI